MAKTTTTPTPVKATTKTTKTSPTTNKIITSWFRNSEKSTLTKILNVTTNRIVENVDVRVINCNHNSSHPTRANAKIANNEVASDIVDDFEDASVDYVEYDKISTMAPTTSSIENFLLDSTVDLTNGVGFINVGVLRSLGKRDVRTTSSSRISSRTLRTTQRCKCDLTHEWMFLL